MKLWKSGSFTHRATIVVNQNRVVRTRPIFRDWKVQADGWIDESQLDLDQVIQIAQNTGDFVGLGDWRPGAPKHGGRFGRFTAKVEAR